MTAATGTPLKPASLSRNTNLDALRAIAVLMVLGRHAGQTIDVYHHSSTTLYTAYWERIGWAGVDLFFVLSGFLISGLLFGDYQQHQRIHISRFYIRRGFKIWPAFYALIGTGLLLDIIRHRFTTKGLLPELVFLQDYFHGIWGITWSLAVEEHFYLCLPLALLLISRRRGQRPFGALPYVFAVMAVLALACRFAVGWRQDGNADFWTCVFPTHLRMDGLMFGVLLCYYQRFRPDVFQKVTSWRGGWIVVAAAVVVLSIFPVESRHMHTWGFTVIYLGAGYLVARAVASEGPRHIRVVSKQLARVGFYSYSIYLWHLFFIRRVLDHLHITSPLGAFWCSIPGAILFGIAAAKVIEIPALGIRDRLFPPFSKSAVDSKLAVASEEFGGVEVPASVTG